MVPVALTELLSDPKLPSEIATSLIHVPMIRTTLGYWERAGLLRAKVLANGSKARLGDALIAQSCIDENVSLLTRDRDFRAFESALDLQFLIDY
jgi:predicted nucleic acid-binding protein